jgi:hypothetical protein
MNPLCQKHGVPLICPACVGASGGAVTSKAKTEAARRNAKKGGWPKGRERPRHRI